MGALHEGHLSLVRAAKGRVRLRGRVDLRQSQPVRPERGFRQVPADAWRPTWPCWPAATRTWCSRRTTRKCTASGHATWVEVGAVAEPLEGVCRPGHFRGVATIVLKLLNMVQPDAAYFGQKDFQQALVIRRMVADLDVPVAIRVCPIVREPDGLAMSSRNRYLEPRRPAAGAGAVEEPATGRRVGRRRPTCADVILQRMRELIETAEDARIDYVALVDPETLEPVEVIAGRRWPPWP